MAVVGSADGAAPDESRGGATTDPPPPPPAAAAAAVAVAVAVAVVVAAAAVAAVKLGDEAGSGRGGLEEGSENSVSDWSMLSPLEVPESVPTVPS